ncbi:MAG: MarR family transcriptional regulator [Saccharofermentans sp.]|nr:MarR family transcriptional regulator [Saccharofermentans sp.]
MRQAQILRENTRRLEMNLAGINRKGCCKVSDTQCFVLTEIGRKPGISIKELSEILRLDKSGISRTVDELVRKGLVIRSQSEEDRRYVTLELTGKGTSQYSSIESDMDQRFKEILARIPKDKRSMVIEALGILSGALE